MKYLIFLSCFITLLAFKSSAQTTSPADTIVWGSVQKNFPGGQDGYNQFVSDSAVYPKVALTLHIMGCSYVQFMIEKDGSITDVKVFRGVGFRMDDVAVELLRHSGKWIPSTANGNPSRTRCKAAVNFVLKANHNNELYGIVNGIPSNPAFLTGN